MHGIGQLHQTGLVAISFVDSIKLFMKPNTLKDAKTTIRCNEIQRGRWTWGSVVYQAEVLHRTVPWRSWVHRRSREDHVQSRGHLVTAVVPWLLCLSSAFFCMLVLCWPFVGPGLALFWDFSYRTNIREAHGDVWWGEWVATSSNLTLGLFCHHAILMHNAVVSM